MHATSRRGSWSRGCRLSLFSNSLSDMTVSFYPRRHETSGRQAFSSQGRQIRGGRRRPPASPLLAFLTTRVIKRFSGNFGATCLSADFNHPGKLSHENRPLACQQIYDPLFPRFLFSNNQYTFYTHFESLVIIRLEICMKHSRVKVNGTQQTLGCK